MMTLITTVSMIPAAIQKTPLDSNTSRVRNASIKTLTLRWRTNPVSAVCCWLRIDNPARWAADARRWNRIVVIWATSTYKHRLIGKQSWTVLTKLFLHLTPYTYIDYGTELFWRPWPIHVDMAILYYGPKRGFLLPFSQVLTDLDEIRQDLLLISLISIFCYFAGESISKLGQYISKLWTTIPVSAF